MPLRVIAFLIDCLLTDGWLKPVDNKLGEKPVTSPGPFFGYFAKRRPFDAALRPASVE
jgi:hypothetical protein